VSEQENLKTIESVYAAFGRADLPFILKALAEDVDWRHPRPADIPWGGDRRGREAVAQFFAAIGQHVAIELFSPDQFIARGDQVIVLGHERVRTRAGGRVYQVEWVHVWTLRDGVVAGFREYTDTATIVDAVTDARSADRVDATALS
jgi:ketosteroid isomerase-like protein